jgi:hypothetical protein
MPTLLSPEQPITSFDDYLATETGGLGIKRAHELSPDAIIEAVAGVEPSEMPS